MEGHLIFAGLVFIAVFLLFTTLTVPLVGEKSEVRKRLKERINRLELAENAPTLQRVLREKYLRDLKPWERFLESLPFMEQLSLIVEQSGREMRSYRLMLISVGLGLLAGVVVLVFTQSPLFGLLGMIVGFAAPVSKVLIDRRRRLDRIEEQLPEALETMVNALRAGHPFTETMKMVSEEMRPPLSREFALTFADINYGNDMRRALLGMLQRVPSLAMMMLVVSILVQRDTGGNITEVLERITKLIRERFSFQRRIKTLSAEGRMGAWVLGLLPFCMFGLLYAINPDYITPLLESETGNKMLMISGVMITLGILWVKQMLKVKV